MTGALAPLVSSNLIPCSFRNIDKPVRDQLDCLGSIRRPDMTTTSEEEQKKDKRGRKTLHGKVGTPLTMRLWEDRTRGSRWVPAFDGSAFKLISDDYKRTIDIRVADTGMRTFEFLPLKPGSHEVTLEQRYGWKFTAEKRLFYTIDVSS